MNRAKESVWLVNSTLPCCLYVVSTEAVFEKFSNRKQEQKFNAAIGTIIFRINKLLSLEQGMLNIINHLRMNRKYGLKNIHLGTQSLYTRSIPSARLSV